MYLAGSILEIHTLPVCNKNLGGVWMRVCTLTPIHSPGNETKVITYQPINLIGQSLRLHMTGEHGWKCSTYNMR